MTFGIFIILALGLLVGIINILPVAGPLSTGISSGIILIIGMMKAWNFLLPISELLICVGIVLVYEVTVWGIHVLWRIYHAVRGNTNGN